MNVYQVIPTPNAEPLLSDAEVFEAAGVGADQVQLEKEFAQLMLQSALSKMGEMTDYTLFPATVTEWMPCLRGKVPLERSGLVDGRVPNASIVSNISLKYMARGMDEVTAAPAMYKVDYTDKRVSLILGDSLLAVNPDDDYTNPVNVTYEFNPGTFLIDSLLKQAAKLLVRAEYDAQQGEGDVTYAMKTAARMLRKYTRTLVA